MRTDNEGSQERISFILPTCSNILAYVVGAITSKKSRLRSYLYSTQQIGNYYQSIQIFSHLTKFPSSLSIKEKFDH